MPEYVLNRDYLLRSTTGRTINFVKGKPVWVPPIVEKEAIAIGADRVDGETTDPLAPEAPKLPELSPDQRKEELFAAFAMLAERNDAKDFTAQGVPSVKALSKIVDFEPEKSEVTEMWAEYKLMKVGG